MPRGFAIRAHGQTPAYVLIGVSAGYALKQDQALQTQVAVLLVVVVNGMLCVAPGAPRPAACAKQILAIHPARMRPTQDWVTGTISALSKARFPCSRANRCSARPAHRVSRTPFLAMFAEGVPAAITMTLCMAIRGGDGGRGCRECGASLGARACVALRARYLT